MQRLRAAGITSAFVSAGNSTVYALGPGIDGTGWPFDVGLGEPWRLVNQAVSTSGRSILDLPMTGGSTLGHILDPTTGRPAEAGVVRAVFRAPRATEADMASTAVVVLGPAETRRWFERRTTWARWRTAVFWLDDADDPVVVAGPGR